MSSRVLSAKVEPDLVTSAGGCSSPHHTHPHLYADKCLMRTLTTLLLLSCGLPAHAGFDSIGPLGCVVECLQGVACGYATVPISQQYSSTEIAAIYVAMPELEQNPFGCSAFNPTPDPEILDPTSVLVSWKPGFGVGMDFAPGEVGIAIQADQPITLRVSCESVPDYILSGDLVVADCPVGLVHARVIGGISEPSGVALIALPEPGTRVGLAIGVLMLAAAGAAVDAKDRGCPSEASRNNSFRA